MSDMAVGVKDVACIMLRLSLLCFQSCASLRHYLPNFSFLEPPQHRLHALFFRQSWLDLQISRGSVANPRPSTGHHAAYRTFLHGRPKSTPKGRMSSIRHIVTSYTYTRGLLSDTRRIRRRSSPQREKAAFQASINTSFPRQGSSCFSSGVKRYSGAWQQQMRSTARSVAEAEGKSCQRRTGCSDSFDDKRKKKTKNNNKHNDMNKHSSTGNNVSGEGQSKQDYSPQRRKGRGANSGPGKTSYSTRCAGEVSISPQTCYAKPSGVQMYRSQILHLGFEVCLSIET